MKISILLSSSPHIRKLKSNHTKEGGCNVWGVKRGSGHISKGVINVVIWVQ